MLTSEFENFVSIESIACGCGGRPLLDHRAGKGLAKPEIAGICPFRRPADVPSLTSPSAHPYHFSRSAMLHMRSDKGLTEIFAAVFPGGVAHPNTFVLNISSLFLENPGLVDLELSERFERYPSG